jgi:phosphatidylglycerol:prolipoprotein diacylglycerol transferase
MYPVLFRIGEFEVTSFGVLVAIASLVGVWLFTREVERSGLPGHASDAAVAGVIGGLLGAKLL